MQFIKGLSLFGNGIKNCGMKGTPFFSLNKLQSSNSNFFQQRSFSRNKLPRSPFKPRRKTNNLKLLIGVLNKRGQRATAETIVFKTLSQIREIGRDPYLAVNEAIEILKPLAELQTKIVGGVNYRIPAPLVADKATSIAMRWLVTSAQERPEKSMAKKLSAEIVDILNGKGYAMKKREEHHKQILVNRAFTRFAK